MVTTNFDNRFVEAGLGERFVDVAPMLPVPKRHNWSSLVHLHGRILVNNDGSNLVLTAADFGRAYLTERWAARFVTELFREFTVIFVGYGVADPVMGYLVDALAAERDKGARPPRRPGPPRPHPTEPTASTPTASTSSGLLFRTLFDGGFPRLFRAVDAQMSHIILALPDRGTAFDGAFPARLMKARGDRFARLVGM